MDLRTILAEVDAWSVEDRIRLIEAVWDGLDDTPETLRLTPAQEQDLKRRIEATRSNPKAGSPWEEVKARLKGDSE
ncbi:addiction module protein [bacterium]|nr:addiction module protein [bacterium]